ncbi:MAG: hypothetical protein ACLU4N_24000 [Butyricimonas faecihominis]
MRLKRRYAAAIPTWVEITENLTFWLVWPTTVQPPDFIHPTPGDNQLYGYSHRSPSPTRQ